MDKPALILMTRLPVAGMVKTRLTPRLSGAACADLQWALLADLAPVLHSADTDLFVFYTPTGPKQTLLRLKELLGSAIYLPQQGDDLGQRMNLAFRQVFQQGYDGGVLIGSDIPFVSNEDIKLVWQVLGDHDAVFGPSEDGGYWLVGLRNLFPPLFWRQNYGHDKVLAQAQAVCSAYRLSVGLAEAKRDIDIWEDLLYYRQNIEVKKSSHFCEFIKELGNVI